MLLLTLKSWALLLLATVSTTVTQAAVWASKTTVLVGLLLLALNIGMLDGEAPDVEVITDADNDIGNEATVNTDPETETQEDKGDLVSAVAKGRGPAKTSCLLEVRTKAVEDAEEKRQDQDIGHWEARFG